MDRNSPAAQAFVEAVERADEAGLRAAFRDHPELTTIIDAPWFAFDTPAFVYTIGRGNREFSDHLLDLGADIDARSAWANGPYSALHHATGGSGPIDRELADHLLARGAHIDLHSAAGLGRLDLLGAFLGTSPQRIAEPGPDGATPLHMAASPEVVDWLLERGAPIDRPCIDHQSTPAMWAVDGRLDVTRRLIDRGARADLWMAAALNDVPLAGALLSADPRSLTARPGDDCFERGDIYTWRFHFATSPLEIARRGGHAEVYAVLSEAAPPELRLLEALLVGDGTETERLLGAHTDLFAHTSADDTVRLLERSGSLVSVLIRHGVDVNTRAGSGRVALHDAAFHGRLEQARLLVEAGADTTVRDGTYGGTPIDWARHNGQSEMMVFLEAAAAS